MLNSQWGIFGVHRCLFEVGVSGDLRVGSLNVRLKWFQITASAQQPKTKTNNRGQEKKAHLKATNLRPKLVTRSVFHVIAVSAHHITVPSGLNLRLPSL